MTSILFKSFLLNLLIILNSSLKIKCEPSSSSDKCFRVAVYEHILIDQPSDQPLKLLNNNFQIYERVVKRASFIDAKIIVFPEYSFLSSSYSRDVLLNKGISPISPVLNQNLCSIYKEKLKNITQSNQSDIEKSEQLQLLDKETIQIDDKVSINNAILRRISCLASDNDIYIAVNLVTISTENNLNSKTNDKLNSDDQSSELDALKRSDQLINDKLTDQLNKINKEQNLNNKYEDYLLFNTELVFDNHGKLVAKYYKHNLFNEKNAINRTDLQLVTFKTEFGKFGILTCSDILYEHPIKGIHLFI